MLETTATETSATCVRCKAELEPEDLRCPLCALACTHDAQAAPVRARAEVLRCDGCGAAISYSAERRAPSCVFCGATMRVEVPVDPIEQAQLVLPFRVDEAKARAALSAWLGARGFFAPGDLSRASTVDTMKPICWAGWITDTDALVSYTGDSDAGHGRASWAPHAGQAPMRFESLLVSASRGLTQKECLALAGGYDLGSARPASEADLATPIERFEVQRSVARERVVDAIHRTAAGRVQHQGHIPGSRFRNVKVAVLLKRLVTRRVAFPAWVLAYRYRGKLHRAVVHGQTAAVIGSSPVSWARIAAVVSLVAAVVAIAAVVASLWLSR